jgi:hypothetical protein
MTVIERKEAIMSKVGIVVSMLALGAFFAGATATTSEAQGARKRTVVNYCPPMPRVSRTSARKSVMRTTTVTTTTRTTTR